MTTYKTRRLALVLLLPLLLLAMGCDSGNGMVDPDPPDPAGAFMIRSDRVAVSPTTLEGTFEASGYINDHGTYTEVLNSPEPLHRLPSLHGKETLKATKGTIEIEFYVGLNPTDHNTIRAVGGFGIVRGSGAYARLQGGGEIDLELERNASAAALTEVLEGEARYVQ